MKSDIRPIHIGCLTEFPFLDTTFDAVNEWQVLQKLGEKTNDIIHFINDILDQKISEYIDERFNDIMVDAMYDAETETLTLYLTHTEEV